MVFVGPIITITARCDTGPQLFEDLYMLIISSNT